MFKKYTALTLSLLLVAAPANAITDKMAGILTGASGVLGALMGKAIVNDSSRSYPTPAGDKMLGVAIGGACAAGLGYLFFYSYTPTAYLNSARDINQEVYKDPLVCTETPNVRYNDQQPAYVEIAEQQRVHDTYPVLDAWKRLSFLQYRLTTSQGYLNCALRDEEPNTALHKNILVEQVMTRGYNAAVTDRLKFLRNSPKFRE
jgi:hypothetical protein